jgi:site-specific DNA-methyltransferase (adenine-specific)
VEIRQGGKTRRLGAETRAMLDRILASEVPARTRSARTGERIEIGDQTIIVGDCAEALALMPERSVDVIVTSPPYNIGLKYRSYDDAGDRNEYLSWLRDIALLLKRVLKDDGSFFLNIAGTSSDPWIAPDAASAMRDLFRLQNSIIWVKSISIGDESFGHFKPVNSQRYLNHLHEHVFHFTKEGDTPLDRLAIGVPFKDKSNIARWGHSEDRRCGGDVWFIPYRTIRSKAQRDHHPSPFPVELAERCIKLHGMHAQPDEGAAEGEKSSPVVLDPFLGVGSTLLAAQRLGCPGIGIEIDASYAEAAAWHLRDRLI